MRPSTRDRLESTIDTATRQFLGSGYRRTTMATVAQALSVSEPAIYRYVEGKEALFALVLRCAVAPGYLDSVESLPYPAPAPDATIEFIREVLEAETQIPALAQPGGPQISTDDARAEFADIIGQLFDRAARFHVALKLVERSAMDWPELAGLWFGTIRARLLSQLADYLAGRGASDHLRPSIDPAVSARMLLEVVAYFAMHRHTDPLPPVADTDAIRDVVISDLTHAFRATEPIAALPSPGSSR